MSAAYKLRVMARKPSGELRRGWTTGACASAAVKAALTGLWSGQIPGSVQITLPRGEMPEFPVVEAKLGGGVAQAGIIKDAGDDPDVTHGALILAQVRASAGGIIFKAGEGVGMVTKPGLPIGIGEPAINPVPRQMMQEQVDALAARFGHAPDIEIEISVPGGEKLALKTWNPRLGIEGGISILGTTGVVRPFSCAAWIASIHRGIDVARASGLRHVAGCTGATSEKAVQERLALPDHAMLDMGDFAGGMLKYMAKNPLERLTIGGGFAKMTKFAQGAMDLHSARSQVDFDALADMAKDAPAAVANSNTAMEALGHAPELAACIAAQAQARAAQMVPLTQVDVLIISRDGRVVGESG